MYCRTVLLLLDNHESRLSVKGNVFAEFVGDNFFIATQPALTNFKFLTVDVLIKKYVNTSCNASMRKRFGKTRSNYKIPHIVWDALPLETQTKTIQAGYRILEVFATIQKIISEDEFYHSSITDRPCPLSSGSLSLEVGKPQEAEKTIVREITSPP